MGFAAVLASLRDFHAGWAWFVIVGNALAGAWALAAHRAPSLRRKSLWWFTAIVQFAIGGQVVLGVIMVSAQDYEVRPQHLFYGVLAVIAAAILYSYRQQLRHRIFLLYGFGGLFMAGLGIRALMKATGS